MSLSIGIVGLPNVGKSTLFNALLQKQQALAANYPFATIEPNVGVVPVPDQLLPQLAAVVHTSQLVPATVEFVDIAGLVAGAAEGAGLGNKFLAHIREVDLIAHVVRAFEDENILREGSVNPVSDHQIIQTELQLADLGTLEKQQPPKQGQPAEMHERWARISRWKEVLNQGKNILSVMKDEDDTKLAKELSLLTAKRQLVVMNMGEHQLSNRRELATQLADQLGIQVEHIVPICAQLESELAALEGEEKVMYLEEMGLAESGLEQLIRQAYDHLGLQSFYTAGEKEARAWTITQGTTAPQAAGVIHTDFERGFIRANIVSADDFLRVGGWKAAKEQGLMRQEGKTYIMKKNDVVEFLVSS